jgi:prepilin-type N-terminal cleavage/methylation domain-containing protein
MKIGQSPRGFTLIELLIVVAIIAILAAIAVPNFLEAQVRAKVTRVQSDMRTMVVALESYAVDNNRNVREWRSDLYADPSWKGLSAYSVPWVSLSSPVAYMTNCLLPDTFTNTDTADASDGFKNFIRYYDNRTRAEREGNNPAGFWYALREFYGDYRLLSYGPNRTFNPRPGLELVQMLYDPTNGTISDGNLMRSRKNDLVQPPVGRILSPH